MAKHILNFTYTIIMHLNYKTLDAPKQHKANIANITASVLSIATLGTLSWLGEASKLANTLTKLNLSKQKAIIKDISYKLSQQSGNIIDR